MGRNPEAQVLKDLRPAKAAVDKKYPSMKIASEDHSTGAYTQLNMLVLKGYINPPLHRI